MSRHRFRYLYFFTKYNTIVCYHLSHSLGILGFLISRAGHIITNACDEESVGLLGFFLYIRHKKAISNAHINKLSISI